MGYRMFRLAGDTPDKIRSQKDGNEEYKIFIWCLRDKSNPGLDVKLKKHNRKSKTKWITEIYRVEWDGKEFVESKNSICRYEYSKPEDAISHAETKIERLSEENSELSHCLSVD